MDRNTGRLIEPRGLTIFQLFAVYVVASQAIDTVERLLPILKRALDLNDYDSFLDTGYSLLIVLAAGAILRFSRDAIIRSELAPLSAVLGFALVLPYVRQLILDVAMESANVLAMGQLGPTRSGLVEHRLSVEPLRMISGIILGAVAAGIWHLVMKRIFKTDAQRLLRCELKPIRGIGLQFLLFAIALPTSIGLGVLIRDAARIWLPTEYGRYGYDLAYALALCAIAVCLVALRGPLRRSDLSPAYIVLSFVLLMISVHNLIDREILNVTRSVTSDQMPWEEALPIRRTINYVANAAYECALNVIGAIVACGVLRLIFGRNLAATVGRTTHSVPKAARAG